MFALFVLCCLVAACFGARAAFKFLGFVVLLPVTLFTLLIVALAVFH